MCKPPDAYERASATSSKFECFNSMRFNSVGHQIDSDSGGERVGGGGERKVEEEEEERVDSEPLIWMLLFLGTNSKQWALENDRPACMLRFDCFE